MIASIDGSLLSVGPSYLIVSVGGIGVRVNAPQTVIADAGGAGDPVFLHTHLIVRENELSLYGFSTIEDRRLFETLIGISGVGPKLALAVLSTLSPELIRSAVVQEEAIILQRVPGIGKKSAERILFSLRGKLDLPDGTATGLVSDVDADVIDVLTSLGFSIVEAQAAIQQLPNSVRSINERVSLALQHLDQG